MTQNHRRVWIPCIDFNEIVLEPNSNILIWLTLKWVQRKKSTFHHIIMLWINSMMTQMPCTEVTVENFQMCSANTIQPNGKLPAPHSHSVEIFFSLRLSQLCLSLKFRFFFIFFSLVYLFDAVLNWIYSSFWVSSVFIGFILCLYCLFVRRIDFPVFKCLVFCVSRVFF